jgi:hypothetical protein
MVYGGTIRPGSCEGAPQLDVVSAFQSYGKYLQDGRTEAAERERYNTVRHACPGPGACGGVCRRGKPRILTPLTLVLQMYTANTMASAAEALGMTLPGDSSFPAEYKEKLEECDSVGPALRNLVEKNILPRDIMTRAAFENAMVRIAHTTETFHCPHSVTSVILPIGIDNDPRGFYKCSAASYRHRAFRRYQPHNRRFPISIGPCSIHRGSQTEWEVRYGGCVQDWWNPWFVLSFFSGSIFGQFLSSLRLETTFLFRTIWFPDLSASVFAIPKKSLPFFFPSGCLSVLSLIRFTDPISFMACV